MDLFRKKEINLNQTSGMKKDLKTTDLIMLGIGAIIGTGIFVVTGVAANQNAGPALVTFICLGCNRCHFIRTEFC